MKPLILHQFAASHFNEKARWALDFKNIEHQRISYLPGPHLSQIKKLTSGKLSTTPVLEADTFIQGSDAIIDFLEVQQPNPPLYPEGETRTATLDWQTRLDKELGPAVRTVVFAVFGNEPGFLAKTFSGNHSPLKRIAFRAMMPLLVPVITKANGAASEENIERCQGVVDQYLNEIAAAVQPGGYLVGDTFTVADLTAAALLAPLARLEHPDMKRPSPIPPTMQSLIDAYAEHPAMDWVHKMYAAHRPAPTNVRGSA